MIDISVIRRVIRDLREYGNFDDDLEDCPMIESFEECCCLWADQLERAISTWGDT